MKNKFLALSFLVLLFGFVLSEEGSPPPALDIMDDEEGAREGVNIFYLLLPCSNEEVCRTYCRTRNNNVVRTEDGRCKQHRYPFGFIKYCECFTI